MILPVSIGVIVVSVVWFVLAVLFAWRGRLINDLLLGVAALVEIGLLVLAVLAARGFRTIDPSSEGATFLAYALSLPVVPIMATLLAIREKTRWAMGVTVVAAFTVAVMTSRIAQIWNLYAR
ncbi:MAG TPA: hypothetical protein PKH97_13735 [Tetrasphaera sp.]|uniref:Integral membrane protein n=1 Tax=Nostocoides vanveenii TaxID=330835 RepID=A0ABP4WW45_9MICO|nr:hypothetical protein [Tetrasphaera sp.]HNQ08233.1 hypothetical protein [Tetrasphaera sp.]